MATTGGGTAGDKVCLLVSLTEFVCSLVSTVGRFELALESGSIQRIGMVAVGLFHRCSYLVLEKVSPEVDPANGAAVVVVLATDASRSRSKVVNGRGKGGTPIQCCDPQPVRQV